MRARDCQGLTAVVRNLFKFLVWLLVRVRIHLTHVPLGTLADLLLAGGLLRPILVVGARR